jgi:uncharacterized membrane protein YqaE (UPF0057 family)
MARQKEDTNYENNKFDWSETSAYRRKLKSQQIAQAKKAGQLAMQGPLSILIVGLIDFLFGIVTSMISLVMDFSSGGFQLVYDTIYDTGTDLIPNSQKFGVAFSMKPIRVLLTVMVPPLGVFLSKGVLGYFNIILCFILTYISFPLGVVYAFVVTYKNRYADRYEQAERMRINMIKEYVRSCTGEADKITEIGDGRISSLVYVGIFLFGLFGLLYWALKNM